jgi:hypothetical protein
LRGVAAACVLALSTGWNTANVGAVAEPLSIAYGVGLAVVGFFTTDLFATHLAMLTFSLPGDGRIGFAAVAAAWTASLVALPSATELGAAPTRACGSRSG